MTKVTYKMGNVTGETTFYDRQPGEYVRDGQGYYFRSYTVSEKDIIKAQKAQAKFYKLIKNNYETIKN